MKGVSPDNLIPNKSVRQMVEKFKQVCHANYNSYLRYNVEREICNRSCDPLLLQDNSRT
eukprot:SAG31_NODE_18021_length_649_cov_1.312727_1_plen_58_part_10